MELVFEPFRDGIDKQGQERENEGIAADNPEHVEASEGVDRGEPFGGRVCGNVFVPGFSGGGFHDSSPVLRGEATPLQVHNVTHPEHLRPRLTFLWRTAPSPWRTAPAGSIVSTSLWMSSTSGRLPISRKADRVAWSCFEGHDPQDPCRRWPPIRFTAREVEHVLDLLGPVRVQEGIHTWSSHHSGFWQGFYWQPLLASKGRNRAVRDLVERVPDLPWS